MYFFFSFAHNVRADGPVCEELEHTFISREVLHLMKPILTPDSEADSTLGPFMIQALSAWGDFLHLECVWLEVEVGLNSF